MMGHREKMKGGGEWDALTRGGRKTVCMSRQFIRDMKRQFNQRVRHQARVMSKHLPLREE